ncbi:hypothetical protein [Candidatus Phytoplasma melaleucae]|uniref:Uncharacterized protein n=1 Tax=Candidatus Phytoplasma melaleucae TaxID=2982630 RepID=A0ABT9DEI1_9MOLU|nr:hypothetical protein ['Melaleuca sp.' phytoplasma]MDO8167976.1 hypothetical protein ['Melaleuca sp.' phytoplasma]
MFTKVYRKKFQKHKIILVTANDVFSYLAKENNFTLYSIQDIST